MGPVDFRELLRLAMICAVVGIRIPLSSDLLIIIYDTRFRWHMFIIYFIMRHTIYYIQYTKHKMLTINHTYKRVGRQVKK